MISAILIKKYQDLEKKIEEIQKNIASPATDVIDEKKLLDKLQQIIAEHVDKIREDIEFMHSNSGNTIHHEKTIETIIDRFRSKTDNIIIAMGPSIRWCCYNVDHDVLEAVKQTTGQGEYSISNGGKNCLDLSTANKYQALSKNIPEKNIWISEECKFCNPDKYYSYRYDKGTTGRQGGFIGKISVIP